jgi:hypothetical protein
MFENALSSYLTPEPMYYNEKEAYEACKPKAEPKEKKVLFEQGDRVVLIHNQGNLGVGTVGIVCNNNRVTNGWDSVAVDVLRAHNTKGELRSTPWSGGHDCYGRVKSRNGKYYGMWIDAMYLRKESSVIDEDILLLM